MLQLKKDSNLVEVSYEIAPPRSVATMCHFLYGVRFGDMQIMQVVIRVQGGKDQLHSSLTYRLSDGKGRELIYQGKGRHLFMLNDYQGER